MTLGSILTSPAAGAVYILLACSALPADVTRMKLAAAPPTAPETPCATDVTRPAGEP